MTMLSDSEAFTLEKLIEAYFAKNVCPSSMTCPVSFGTSGHRGTSLNGSFTESHIAAITQAICDYRNSHNIHGPLYMGRDTHALSTPAMLTAIEVLVANEISVIIQKDDLPVPTPVISRSILQYNHQKDHALADGIIITPSHNPPEDGGLKYNESHGGPACAAVTALIEKRANIFLEADNIGVKRVPLETALSSHFIRHEDLITAYVDDLGNVLDMQAIAEANISLGVDPLGGASLPLWEPIATKYHLNLTVVNKEINPLFTFMPKDFDGKIRMDCSSSKAMGNLIALAKNFDLAFANDPDADRHGIVTPTGLMQPNHYLAVCVDYLLQTRKNSPLAKIGKTCVTTALIDKIAQQSSRQCYETPVGFKWFVTGLLDGSLLFGGEESAGASFLMKDGKAWTTDKDGILLNLLAAEMTAKTGKTPDVLYNELTESFGTPSFKRIDAPASPAQKKAFASITPETIATPTLAGEPILSKTTMASGNNESIGGIKITTENGWFAARPSGTEELYKIYAESLKSEEHLASIVHEAQEIIASYFHLATVTAV